jgi:HEPN domain-containing protein
MPGESNKNESEDWFLHGDNDFQSAKLLFKNKGPTENIAFFLQQAVEKYLKGYLLSKGWKLQKIHDLEVLISEAIRYDKAFKAFLDFARVISAVYVESRYPAGPPKEYSIEKISEWLEQTEKLITFIKEETK